MKCQAQYSEILINPYLVTADSACGSQPLPGRRDKGLKTSGTGPDPLPVLLCRAVPTASVLPVSPVLAECPAGTQVFVKRTVTFILLKMLSIDSRKARAGEGSELVYLHLHKTKENLFKRANLSSEMSLPLNNSFLLIHSFTF